MTGAPTAVRSIKTRKLERFFNWHPEWWVALVVGVAWLLMLPHAWHHFASVAQYRLALGRELQLWLLMVTAMMLPFAVEAIQVTATGSLWSRRQRAIIGFISGYFSSWLAVGLIVVSLLQLAWLKSYVAVAVMFVVAAIWQLTPAYKSAVIDCHRRRLPAPVGWRADRDCFFYGGVIGSAQVASCLPFMLACAMSGHGLLAMIGGLAVAKLEHWTFRPPRHAVLAISLALAAYYVVLAGLNGFI